jgi:hypothetical protein
MRRRDLLERRAFVSITEEEPPDISDYSSDSETGRRTVHISHWELGDQEDSDYGKEVENGKNSMLRKFGEGEGVMNKSPGDVCVIATAKGRAAPKCASVEERNTRLRWMHYRGFRQSPFLPLPDFLKRAIAQWRQYTLAPIVNVGPGKEPITTCHICGTSIDDPANHKKSEQHSSNVEHLDWTEFGEVAKQLSVERGTKPI